MFDGRFRTNIEQGLKPVGANLRKTGITADHLTVLGILMGVFAYCLVVLRTIRGGSYREVPSDSLGLNNGEKVAVIYASGAINVGRSSDSPLTGEMVGSDTIVEAVNTAANDSSIKAIVLRVDSPGGSALASDLMWYALENAKAKKPVVVSMGDVAASGGYWIATAGETIVANPLTITGSIGVFSLFFDLGDFLDNKLGITTDFVTTSPYADMFSGMRPLSERERVLMQRATDETYQTFLEKVADARGLDVVQVDSIGQGRIWTGLQARDLELAAAPSAFLSAAFLAGAFFVVAFFAAFAMRCLPRRVDADA